MSDGYLCLWTFAEGMVAYSVWRAAGPLGASADELRTLREMLGHSLRPGGSLEAIAEPLRRLNDRHKLLTREESARARAKVRQEAKAEYRAEAEKLRKRLEAERVGLEVEAEIEAERVRNEASRQTPDANQLRT